MVLEDTPGETVDADGGKAFGNLFARKDVVFDTELFEGQEVSDHVSVVVGTTHPEEAGFVVEGGVGLGVEVFVDSEGFDGPTGVDLFGAVTGARDAGFAAGAGAVVGGAVLVDEGDGGSGLAEHEGGPGSEDSGADDGDVGKRFGLGHGCSGDNSSSEKCSTRRRRHAFQGIRMCIIIKVLCCSAIERAGKDHR